MYEKKLKVKKKILCFLSFFFLFWVTDSKFILENVIFNANCLVCRWCEVIIKTCSWFWLFLCCNKFLHWGNCRGRPIDPTVNTPTVIALTVITPTGNPTCCVIARNSSGANRDGWQGTRRHGWRPPRVYVCVGVIPSAKVQRNHRDTLCFY